MCFVSLGELTEFAAASVPAREGCPHFEQKIGVVLNRVEVGWQKWGMREHFLDLCSRVLICAGDPNHYVLVNLNQILRK